MRLPFKLRCEVRYLCLTIREVTDDQADHNSEGPGDAEAGAARHLGVGPGAKVEAEKLPDGRIVVRAAELEGAVNDFIGCLAQRRGPKLTIREINEIVARGWAKDK